MIQRRVVRRYAAALLSAARRANVIDRVESDLGLVAYTLDSVPLLRRAVRSPVVPRERKKQILEELLGDKLHPLTLSFLKLLVDKRREEILSAVEPEYVQLADEVRGIAKAQVLSAVELTEEQKRRLAEGLSRATGKNVLLSIEVDKSIIGGVVVRIGDTVIDGSIRGQLAAIKERLMGGM
ncbi:MAG: F0F1 ATP synthase subunit delta [Armatimonadota bacterium]|nr:F0F1 ATP synthase subunit delta [Armatimonadota bacterium]